MSIMFRSNNPKFIDEFCTFSSNRVESWKQFGMPLETPQGTTGELHMEDFMIYLTKAIFLCRQKGMDSLQNSRLLDLMNWCLENVKHGANEVYWS